MDIYRIPRREVSVRILVDDGRTLDGTLFTAEGGAAGRREDVLQYLNGQDEDFVPLVCGEDRFLLNKVGIVWVQVAGSAAGEFADEAETGQQIPVRLTLAGGLSLDGTLAIVMPRERSRAIDYLNACGRFLPLFGDGIVTLVQRRFVVTVRNGVEDK